MQTSIPAELVEKIARNVNAMQLTSDPRNRAFWLSAYARIYRVVKQLTEAQKFEVARLCSYQNAKFFKLI
jgi:hypothetical protein